MDIVLKYFDAFTPQQLEQLKALEGLYREWNEKINVISRKDIAGLYEKHVLHSLSIAAVFSFTAGTQIADLGAGGGFPGIPLAIFFPEVEFLLVDSIGKKLKVADGIAAAIGLKNISTRHSRIEEVKDRQFDFVVSRAVAPLKNLWQWSRPLIKKDNTPHTTNLIEQGVHAPGLICLKGGDLAQEISESGTRPHLLAISDLFTEPFFEEKYMVYVPK
ncbi:16S rRNA (guanine(527)-N(7))-methyltransferase [Niabella ginsenosidivorans]|uniref:Ribosomal RNA small subunit methyltransferase G n=1 Tax=Niabella ginsenosidivorans TaxID=1176587 RepID=A0A1A9HXS5_9BACT|nr:16S rRNA (guanine(527)-N(7))-methyltransferase RsmG [Niabella ginsenosidivorans]ANH80186.1 16S rRNA (guanine(527)-N(7))-methyltransferase [Niabella ginsenosidivorans]